jgi:GrpB-like predicted nucleotidyltransferase (UPF0157 family)
MAYHLSRPIVIAAYDPAWPALFEEERRRLAPALAPVVRRIEHIGSTSVPGLGAKPILDISASVADLDAVDGFVPALAGLGYEDARIDPAFGRRLFTRGGYNEGTHHLHFTVHGSPTWAEPILLRDYLRARPEAAARYERVKRDSAARHGTDLNGYHDEKSPCITSLMAEAAAWQQA